MAAVAPSGCIAALLLDSNGADADTERMSAETPGFHGYLTIQSRGTVALPPSLRRKYALDKPGAQVEITEREDGVIEVRPLVAVPAGQAYFWTEDWQAREREVDAHLARGEFTDHADANAFLGHLDAAEETATDITPGVATADDVQDCSAGSPR